jgi:hypothetical protein
MSTKYLYNSHVSYHWSVDVTRPRREAGSFFSVVLGLPYLTLGL